jgi:HYDIN/CFA65/VesB-like, Ig-like domain/Abnormal spindle-like microcephaly-assoc'd, ASPM-SPD-2-Hydin
LGSSDFKSPAAHAAKEVVLVKDLGSRHAGIQHGFYLLILLTTLIAFGSDASASSGLVVNPSSINFGNVRVGSGATQSVTLTNSGGPKITISQVSVAGTGFTIGGLSYPVTLAGGQSITCTVTFTPPSTGADNGSLSIMVNTQGSGGKKTNTTSTSTMILAMSGTGVSSGQLAASPSGLNFTGVQVGSSQSSTETLTNSGAASLTISAVNITGSGFSWSGLNLPFTLAVGQSTSFSIAFAPAAAGTVSGNVAISSNASNSTINIPLSGASVTSGQLSANATSLSFGSVATGSSTTLGETVTNVGGSAVTISQTAVSGAGFSFAGINPPLTLSPNQSASFTVTFSPQISGSTTGNLTVSSNASNPTLAIALSGTGTYPGQLALSPSSINFGNVAIGGTQSQSATLTANNGPVTVSSASVNQSEFSLNGIALPITIPSGYSLSFSVVFAPQASGTASANVTFSSNATNTPTTQAVSGSGTAPVVNLTWNASSSGSIAGYNIYRGTVSGGPYTQINGSLNPTTSNADATVQNGQTYYYVVTAVDVTGAESAYSNQTTAVVP